MSERVKHSENLLRAYRTEKILGRGKQISEIVEEVSDMVQNGREASVSELSYLQSLIESFHWHCLQYNSERH